MNFLNEVTARFPDAVSFAPGRPYDEAFEPSVVAGYLDAYAKYLERDRGLSQRQVGGLLFQYGRTKGQIHDLVAATIANDEGIEVPPESIVVTVGAQEGMLLALRVLFRDFADVLLVASPCYVGITGAARLLDIAVEPVPEGPSGVDAGAVRAAADRVRASGRRPRALYVVPDFANPSGTSMPLSARHELLAAAVEQDLYVLEDNPYGLFARTAQRVPTLKRLDEHRRVVYLGSFAKTCFPGARVGYAIADQPVVAPDGSVTLLADQLSKIKSMTTVNTSPLAQAVVGGMLVTYGCRLRVLNEERIRRYRERLDALLAALGRCFGGDPGYVWNVPGGGFFLVLTVPFVADEAALTRSARDHGVLWTPMSYFYAGAGGDRQIRLSCSYLEVDEIDEGVRRLRGFTRDA
ncbi:PLP-dependent aminotransferase family protein [Phytohabitans flavus]|uniref:aminotransferase-like domain-containing protein n=1 Tax=Phytohabitans flavus TaxID=1076124 RepID=UPI0031E641B1